MLSQSSMKAFMLTLFVTLPCGTHAFIPQMPTATAQTMRGLSTRMSVHDDSSNNSNSRGTARSKIEHAVAVAVASSIVVFGAASGPALAEELPPGTNPFTSICMGFGCGEFQGLDYPGAPAPTDEESITFKAFLDSLDKGVVAKVDFLSGGDKAYAFLKPAGGGSGEPTRIRIGEGYPDEQTNGWSSPLWVVRALNDRNVPYHFEYNLGKGRATQTVAK